MRSSRNLILICLLLTSFMVAASPVADPIGGPSLGYSPNMEGSAVWPILGIPGAALMGQPLSIGTAFVGAVVSPRQDYFLALRSEDGQPMINRLTSEPRGAFPIEGTQRGSAIAISAAGTGAALFNQESKTLQVLQGLPASPVIAFEADTSTIPGQVTALAVSDDASIALIGVADGGNDSLWVVRASGSRFVTSGRASSLAFLVNRHDAVIADGIAGEAFLLLRVDDTPSRFTLFSAGEGVDGLSGIGVSDDGRFAVVAGAASGTIGIVDMEKSVRSVVSCNCRPSGVHRMTGTAVFRLNEPPDTMVTVVDLSSGKPRILVVPPLPKTADAGAGTPR